MTVRLLWKGKAMIYFTSDLHLGHSRITELCSRPFADVLEMDKAIIENWNRRVKKNDTVYLIGDAVWDKKKVGFYMEQLSGKKILITGNHDSDWVKKEECRAYFETVTDYLVININGHPITMCHYPMLEWKGSREKTGRKLGYHIHGHIHNRVAEEYHGLYMQFNALNAGVDVNGYEPVSFERLIENNLRFKLDALTSEKDREILIAKYNEMK